MSKIQALLILVVIAICQFSWAARLTNLANKKDVKSVAIYFGTFNPYHMGHEHITEGLLSKEGFDAVVPVPNYYTFHKPFTTPWSVRIELLEARYYDHPKVFLPLEKAIRPPEIVDFLRAEFGPRIKITYVAGMDVIEDWRARLWMNTALLNSANEILIINSTGEASKDFDSNLFEIPVRFAKWKNSPVRGSKLRAEIEVNGLSEKVRQWVHPAILQRALAMNLYGLNDKKIASVDLDSILLEQQSKFKLEVQPGLDDFLESFGTKLNWNQNLYDQLVWKNIEDFTEFTEVQWLVYQAVENKEVVSFQELSNYLLDESVLKFYKQLSQVLKELKPIDYHGIQEHYFANSLGLVHRIAKFLSGFKNRLINFDGIKLGNDIPPNFDTDWSRSLKLYRGYKIPENMTKDEFINHLQKIGSLSQTARNEMLKGKSYEKAIGISNSYLQAEGDKELVINHVLGNWRETSSLISATTDFDLARSFAGEKGIVIEIQTTADRVLNTNEYAYWKDTPFEKEGNPRFLQAEVAIKNIIFPHEIIAIHEVTDLIIPESNNKIRNWQFETSIKAMLWTNYLRVKQAIAPFCRNSTK